jgi:hypothetical protein
MTKFQLSGDEYHIVNGKAKTARYVAGRDIKITSKKKLLLGFGRR